MRKSNVFQGFGRRIQHLRKARGWSQERLGDEIGKTVNTVSNIERGVNSTRLETVDLLAKVFGVTVAELFGPEAGGNPTDDGQRELAKVIQLLETRDVETIRHVRSIISAVLEIKRPRRTPRGH